MLAGRFSPCDITPAIGAVCLLSCWTHECRRGPGLVVLRMTLDLPRRGRLGRDQLQIKPCLEPDTVGRLCLLPYLLPCPYLPSVSCGGRRKGCCWKCKFHSWGDPRAHSWARDTQRICSEGSRAGHGSWRAADTETRKGSGADGRAL